MSSQPAPALAPQPEPPKVVPELTDAYRKAHKSYVLASGLLASWELIGITLDTKEKYGIELKSPKAVPLILFTLVIYSGYKMTIEWMQCHPERRQHTAAKWDYRIAHGLAFVAIAISLIQYLLLIQVADIPGRHRLIFPAIVLLAIWASGLIAMIGSGPRSSFTSRVLWLIPFFAVYSCVLIFMALIQQNYTARKISLILVLLSLPVAAWLSYSLWKRFRPIAEQLDARRKKGKQPTP